MLACLRANSAFFDVKLVAAHGSVIYSPCFQIACNVPFAKWTNIVTLPRGNVSVFDTKTMPACTAAIYLTVRTLLLTDAAQKGHAYWNISLPAFRPGNFAGAAFVSFAALAVACVSCCGLACASAR